MSSMKMWPARNEGYVPDADAARSNAPIPIDGDQDSDT